MLNISIKKFYDTLSTITGYDEKDLLPESKLIEDFQPELIDVASGVESAPGIKDAEKLKKFFSELNKL